MDILIALMIFGVGIAVGVIFDEALTTKFNWFTAEGRRKLKELF